MRQLIKTFAFIIVILLFCSNKQKFTDCEILEKIKYSKIKQFSPEIKFGFEANTAVYLNQNEYKELFGNDKNETETCVLFGKFNSNKNRIGVYSHRSTYECDSRLSIIELHVFEKCKIVGSTTIMIENNHVMTYQVSSKFNKDFDQLTITEKVGSEYTESDSKIDTLFINTYRIDLKSKSLDTICRNTRFELLKSAPEE